MQQIFIFIFFFMVVMTVRKKRTLYVMHRNVFSWLCVNARYNCVIIIANVYIICVSM